FGANAELHAAIREGEASKILQKPYESAQGWHVIKIVSHRERVEQPFEEIREQVREDTVAARNREVSKQFVKELFEADRVKLYPQALGVVEHADASGGSNSDESEMSGDSATP
ncbi:MAG: hypothetical protein KDA54_13435, partial [Phycisphaerales bacterium]|nr:hypothetical protein [Phycisphaerales bacterium]